MNLLLQLLQGRKVAIVGNGNVKEDHSAEIDSADVVIRFNHFYNYDSGLVGKKVDIVLQTITPMYYNASNRHDDIVREQKPIVFLVKNHFPYDTKLHEIYGKDVKVENYTRVFDAYKPYTTGTTALAYLADHLINAEVRCYGFQDDVDWERYLATDAKNFHVLPIERSIMMDSINRLEALKITEPHKEIEKKVVIPVKKTSLGFAGKNRLLIDNCIKEAQKSKIPIVIVGDDEELMRRVEKEYGVEICILPEIKPLSDVTNTLKDWRDKTGYAGYLAIVLCTSPRLKAEWIDKAFDELRFAPISATATPLTFKPTAIYQKAGGVFVKACLAMPPASVARQLLPETVRITGAVVACHTDALDFESFYDAGVMRPVIVTEEEALDIDTKEDYEKRYK